MLSSDFRCKENDGSTGAAHSIQTFFFFFAISPDIRRVTNLANRRSLVFLGLVNYKVTIFVSRLTFGLFKPMSCNGESYSEPL